MPLIDNILHKTILTNRKKHAFFLVENKIAVYLHPLSKIMVCSSRG